MPELDETKRLLMAIALAAAVFLVWTILFPPAPPPEETAPAAPVAESIPGEAAPDALETAEAEPGDEAAEAAPAEAVTAEAREEIEVSTGLARIVLVNRGAVPISWTLLEYEDYDSQDPVELIDRRAFDLNRFPLQFDLGTGLQAEAAAQDLNRALWHHEIVQGVGTKTVRFTYADGRGLSAEKVLVFREGSYRLEVKARVLVDGRPVPFALVWGPGIANHPRSVQKNRYFQRPRIAASDGREFDTWSDPDDSPELAARPVVWAGVDDQYFAALATPAAPRAGFRYWEPATVEGEDEDDYPAPFLAVPFQAGGETLSLYVGPKQLQVLKRLGGDYWQTIEMGRWIGFIARWLLYALIWIHEHIIANFGWAIIILTVLIRLIFFPLTQSSMKKMKEMSEKMKRVQPQQKAIKEKYKGEKDVRKRQQMNEEIMALYRREGVNPQDQLSGCLPILLQMPIFFAFFRMLPASIELRGEPWVLWIRDLSAPDPTFITPILMGAAMFYSTKRSMSQQATMEGFQKQIFYFMPIMFTVICLWAPSGLVIYWLFSNLIQMGQQELLRRGSTPPEGAGKAGEKGKPKEKDRGKAAAAEAPPEAGDESAEEAAPAAPKKQGGRRGGRKKKRRR